MPETAASLSYSREARIGTFVPVPYRCQLTNGLEILKDDDKRSKKSALAKPSAAKDANNCTSREKPRPLVADLSKPEDAGVSG
jgi:hypothetical protein